MGVDIRQWGANAGRNVTTQIKDRTKAGGAIADGDCCADFDATSEPKNQTLIDDGDDDDDEVGPAEVEILVALNVEGYRKLNAYAHTINPVSGTAQPLTNPTSDQLQTLPPHPMLSVLNDTIKASAGKMEHGVLDHAATVCQRLEQISCYVLCCVLLLLVSFLSLLLNNQDLEVEAQCFANPARIARLCRSLLSRPSLCRGLLERKTSTLLLKMYPYPLTMSLSTQH